MNPLKKKHEISIDQQLEETDYNVKFSTKMARFDHSNGPKVAQSLN